MSREAPKSAPLKAAPKDLKVEFLDGAGRGTGWGSAPLYALLYRWARFKELFSYSVLKASIGDLGRAARGRAARRGA